MNVKGASGFKRKLAREVGFPILAAVFTLSGAGLSPAQVAEPPVRTGSAGTTSALAILGQAPRVRFEDPAGPAERGARIGVVRNSPGASAASSGASGIPAPLGTDSPSAIAPRPSSGSSSAASVSPAGAIGGSSGTFGESSPAIGSAASHAGGMDSAFRDLTPTPAPTPRRTPRPTPTPTPKLGLFKKSIRAIPFLGPKLVSTPKTSSSRREVEEGPGAQPVIQAEPPLGSSRPEPASGYIPLNAETPAARSGVFPPAEDTREPGRPAIGGGTQPASSGAPKLRPFPGEEISAAPPAPLPPTADAAGSDSAAPGAPDLAAGLRKVPAAADDSVPAPAEGLGLTVVPAAPEPAATAITAAAPPVATDLDAAPADTPAAAAATAATAAPVAAVVASPTPAAKTPAVADSAASDIPESAAPSARTLARSAPPGSPRQGRATAALRATSPSGSARSAAPAAAVAPPGIPSPVDAPAPPAVEPVSPASAAPASAAPSAASPSPAASAAAPPTSAAAGSTSPSLEATDLNFPNPAVEENEALRAKYSEGVLAGRAKNYEGAARLFREYASNHSLSRLAPRALFLAAILDPDPARSQEDSRQLKERFSDSKYVAELERRRPTPVEPTPAPETAAGAVPADVTLLEQELAGGVTGERAVAISLTLGQAYLQREEYARALQVLVQALEAAAGSPSEAEILILISDAAIATHDLQRAGQALENLEQRHPAAVARPRVRLNQGLLFEEAGAYQRARSMYNALLQESPDSTEAQLARERLRDLRTL